MGVKRSEMRLLTAYVEARLELAKERINKLDSKPLKLVADEERMAEMNGARRELDKLFEILGGYND